ncbi:Rha family transcriptional regulator [Lactococcus formosensis]|uniref:Rha family transcriptional regulator n=1 Tax=Lactococcus formosensis TaxID=1281486 RepID=UPI00254B4D2D|nr:Rha family transcriptional regulator [Lactococcus formosensis]
MNQIENTLTSLEVAEMVGKDHKHVLEGIRQIIKDLGEPKSGPSSEIIDISTFFIESTYRSAQNKELPCYLVTKQGCEVFGNRMTGAKGTQFTVGYVTRFNQMEQHIKQQTSNLSPELQMFNQLFQASANVELEQKRQAEELENMKNSVGAVEKSVDNISNIVALNTTNWREDSNNLIRKMSQKVGGDSSAYSDIRTEIYAEVDRRANCDLGRRLSNLKGRMALEGNPKSKINKANKLDILERETRLKEIYMKIVQEFAIKYQIEV